MYRCVVVVWVVVVVVVVVSAVSVGSSCLACDSDGLWYRATVVQLPHHSSDTDTDNKLYTTDDTGSSDTEAGDDTAAGTETDGTGGTGTDAGCGYHVMFDLSQRDAVIDACQLFPLHSTSRHVMSRHVTAVSSLLLSCLLLYGCSFTSYGMIIYHTWLYFIPTSFCHTSCFVLSCHLKQSKISAASPASSEGQRTHDYVTVVVVVVVVVEEYLYGAIKTEVTMHQA